MHATKGQDSIGASWIGSGLTSEYSIKLKSFPSTNILSNLSGASETNEKVLNKDG
jgi:hypothetical protein